jgi:hypothetical protein
MDLKKSALAAMAGLVGLALYLTWLWQPELQVRLHQKHFLQAVERRNWDAVEKFLADDYADRWEHDKAFVVSASREVFRQFLFLTVEHRIESCVVEGADGVARVTVKITGSGGPVAQYVVSTVNALREPFVFSWVRRGRPWDWQLIRFEQRELKLDQAPAF